MTVNVSILFLLVIVSVLLHTDDCMYINARGRKHQSLHYPARRFPSIPSCVLDASATTATTTDSKKIFWSDGLKFECTACGKCCRNDGEVWLDTDEFAALCDHLQKTPQEVLLAYSDTVMNGWVKLRNKVSDPTNAETKEGDSCIFLDNDGKKCTIYDARPIQCRTYPYWPRLLDDENKWNKEAVVPDSAATGKKWNANDGGCEGIQNADAPVIPVTVVHRNHELYKMYNDAFPFTFTGDDWNRLITKVEVIQGIIRSTKAWIDQIVIKYSLCPFASSVFQSNKIRYVVCFGHKKEDIIKKLEYEYLALTTSKEEDIATTLLIIPFAMQSFDDFYKFSLNIEDNILPKIERNSYQPKAMNDNSESSSADKSNKRKKKKTLIERAKDTLSGTSSSTSLSEVQLAFFHPGFCWSDTDVDDPINYEKKSPFPTINLLRANRVREYADENKTADIAGNNFLALEKAGKDVLQTLFAQILHKAFNE